ncbi:MAG: MarR family transcriptional regulator [Bacteroidota bacterium]|nr:MarR family transcriptional regulator [Bacteroidota bacterium]
MKLEESIKMSKPFKDEFSKAFMNIIYSSSILQQRIERVLKPFHISSQQFNILRILKGQSPNLVSLKIISERMIDKTSNTSRLIEKLLAKNMVERVECPKDRRKVDIKITDVGLATVNHTSQIVESQVQELFKPITDADAVLLNTLLDKLTSDL